MVNKTVTTPLFILGLITLSVVLWYSLPRRTPLGINLVGNPSGTIELRLDPSSRIISVGSELALSLQAKTGSSRLTAAQIELAYNSACGTPTFVPGNTLSTVLVAPRVASGKISATLGVAPQSGGLTGENLVIATLKLKPLQVGQCQLDFTSSNVVTSIGSSTNSLATTSGAVVAIASNSSPTPTHSTRPSTPTQPTLSTSPALSSSSPRPSSSSTPQSSSPPSQATPTLSPEPAPSEDASSKEPNFLQMVFLGWQTIITNLLDLLR